MLSRERHQSILLHAPKVPHLSKQPTSGTLSPETTTTTSSGYSTGGSSVSTTIKLSSKKSATSIGQKQIQPQQHNVKSKGKKKKYKSHVVKRTYLCSSYFDHSASRDDIFYTII